MSWLDKLKKWWKSLGEPDVEIDPKEDRAILEAVEEIKTVQKQVRASRVREFVKKVEPNEQKAAKAAKNSTRKEGPNTKVRS